MSELRRWAEEGAVPEELSLIEASRKERPHALARAQTLRALGLSGPLPPHGTQGAHGATTSGILSAHGAVVSSTIKLVGLLLVAPVAAAGWLHVREGRLGRGAIPTSSASAPVATPASYAGNGWMDCPAPCLAETNVGAPSASRLGDVETVATVPTATEYRNRTETLGVSKTPSADAADAGDRAGSPGTLPSSSAANPLGEEVALLKSAQDVIARDPVRCLEILGRYRSRFSAGALADEEVVVRVEALLGVGDTTSATAAVDDYCREHPRGPYQQRLRKLVSHP